MVVSSDDWLQVFSKARPQGRLASLSGIAGRLTSIADTSASTVTITLVASSCVIDVRVFGIDLNSLVICVSILSAA